MRRYIIPSLNDGAQPDRLCPRCNTPSGHIHQKRQLAISDTRIGSVTKLRLRCRHCHMTWTCQPAGLKAHFQRSQRVRALNVLFYALGLSYAATAQVMTALGAPESDTSVYRDLVASMSRAKALHQRGRRKVRVAGIDATYQRLAQPEQAHYQSTIFVVDFSDGHVLEVELLDEADAQAVAALIKDLEAKYDIQLWVSDEHTSYEQAIAPERHWLCTTHFKKNKLRRVKELQQQARSERIKRDLQELEGLLRAPPEDGKEQARQLYRRQPRVKRPPKGKPLTVASKLKQLAREVYEKWERVWHETNNATESAIGLCLKIRSKLMRGYKVAEHISGFARLRGWMYEQSERVELGCLL
jgi:propanediol dehydratase large subunit